MYTKGTLLAMGIIAQALALVSMTLMITTVAAVVTMVVRVKMASLVVRLVASPVQGVPWLPPMWWTSPRHCPGQNPVLVQHIWHMRIMPVKLELNRMPNSRLVRPLLWSPGVGLLYLLLLCMELLPLGLVKLKHPTTTPNNNWYLMHSRLVTSPRPGVHKLHGRLMHGVSWLRSVMLMRRWPLRLVLDVGLVVVPPVH